MALDATLLLIRPRAASVRFADQLQAAIGDMRFLISPLMEIEPVPLDPSAANADTIVFTSINAVQAWARAQLPTHQRCFCVGEATGAEAKRYGFEPEISGGTLEHLIDDLTKVESLGRAMHIRGEHTRGDLKAAMAHMGHDAHDSIAYRQHLRPFSQQALDLLIGGEPVIVPLFSPRSAGQFASECPVLAQPDVIAISKAAASHYPKARLAQEPSSQGMIAAIAQGFQSPA